MNPQVSSRLDLLRALAALSVFFYHFSYLGYSGRALPPEVGRLGVLTFFVMSGYVIAYVAAHKHGDLQHYINARVARLLSVFLPALLLTVVCDTLGRQLDSVIYANYPDVYEVRAWLRLPFFLTFFFENSLISLRWFSNGPMWSIAYEFWYYVLYGLLTYTRGWRRICFLAIALLLAGWKIMLLAPVWCAGVLLYRYQGLVVAAIRRWRLPLFWFAMALIFVCLLPATRTHTGLLSTWGSALTGKGMHMYFLSDYVQMVPLLLLMATLLVPSVATHVNPLWHSLIRAAADNSFSVYLYHVPLMLLFRSIGFYDTQSLVQSLGAGVLTLLCCGLMARLTEQRKSVWLRWVQVCANALITNKQRIFKNA